MAYSYDLTFFLFTSGVSTTIPPDLQRSVVSGILGLAFQTMAVSGAKPFWQTLAEGGSWDEPLMTFQLNRFVSSMSDVPSPSDAVSEGLLTMLVHALQSQVVY